MAGSMIGQSMVDSFFPILFHFGCFSCRLLARGQWRLGARLGMGLGLKVESLAEVKVEINFQLYTLNSNTHISVNKNLTL